MEEDIEEFGYNRQAGFIWSIQKKKEGSHLQEDEKGSVICSQGDRICVEGDDEEDDWCEDQRTHALPLLLKCT